MSLVEVRTWPPLKPTATTPISSGWERNLDFTKEVFILNGCWWARCRGWVYMYNLVRKVLQPYDVVGLPR